MNATAAENQQLRGPWRTAARARAWSRRISPRPTQIVDCKEHSLQSDSALDLTEVLAMAVELNRNNAIRHGVRVHCYSLDQVLSGVSQDEQLQRFDAILGRAVQNAQFGSLITGQAGIRNGRIELHIRYARPTLTGASSMMELDWIDEVWCWQPGEPLASAH